jgi:1,2-diacylglycerol 3-alpha-glucosyltransferase
MRVLMISDVYFPRVNGVSTSIQVFRAEMPALGVHTALIAPRYPGGASDPDADLMRVASVQVPRDPEDRLMRAADLRRLRRELRAGQFDIVHVQTPFVAHYAGLAIARQLQVPVVETYHTYFEHYLHHYLPFLPSPLTRFAARRFTVSQCAAVDAVIAPSSQMADGLRGYGVRTPIRVIPTGMPRSAFVPGEGQRFRAAHGIAADRPVATFVGRVAFEKNIDFLLDMLQFLRAAVPNVLLVIAGEGPASDHLRRRAQAERLAGNVLFVGYLERSTALRDCYRAADVFVFASRTETQGLVLLEAMAQGTPVVSTAVMGTIDVLAGTSGSVVVPEDRRAFADAVAAVLTDSRRRAELGRRALEDAHRWSARVLAEKLVTLYREVVDPGALEVNKESHHGHRNVVRDA